jgi:hypothetical protein
MTHEISPQVDEPARQKLVPPKASPKRLDEQISQTHPLVALQRIMTAQLSSLTPVDLVNLQRTIGNRATGKMLTSHAGSATTGSRSSLSSIQKKLVVGAAGDRFEQEADQVAERVVKEPAPFVKAHNSRRQPEKEVATENEGEGVARLKPLMRRGGGGTGAKADSAVESRMKARSGDGNSLVEPTLAYMEQRFGADFGGVRVHHNGEADALNRSLRSRAFTTGQNIFFRRGEYDPYSAGGRKLIAHELTHVLQQSDNSLRPRHYDRDGESPVRVESGLGDAHRVAPVSVSQAAPAVQCFNDGEAEVDISTLDTFHKVHGYILRIAELSIPPPEVDELLAQFKVIIDAENDPSVIHGLLSNKAFLNLTNEEIKILEVRLESLKYNAGLQQMVDQHNWPQDFLSQLDKFSQAIIKQGEQDVSALPSKRKRLALTKGKGIEELRQALTREGSVGLNLESKYDPEEVKERQQKRVKTTGQVTKAIKSYADAYSNLYKDENPFYPGSRGREMYKQSLFKYQFEGMVGTYENLQEADLQGPPDFFEFDHQPQNDLIEKAAELTVSAGKKIQNVIPDHSRGGLTIVLAHSRHAKGASYGKATTRAGDLATVDNSADDAPTKIANIKKILKEETESDANEILTIYGNHAANYEDVGEIESDPLKSELIKADIEAQVKRGEAKIKAQTFNEWFEDI